MPLTPPSDPSQHPDLVLAADIGGTSMRAALVEVVSGAVHGRLQVRTEPEAGFEAATDRLAGLLEALRREASEPPGAVGVSTAGPVDPRSGEYRYPPNLPGWHGRTMVPALAERLGLPVRVGHDATLAALAETRFGAHAGAGDLVYITVSTGIGAGIVAGGRVVTGSTGGAGEVGHLIVNPGGPSCGAGCPGCLEGQSSGTAISARAAERLGRALPAEEVVRLADAGDAVAEAILGEAVHFLGSGLASVLALLDPEVIVLGGGLARGLQGRWPQLLEETRRHALPRYAGGVPVEFTTLGDDASLLGAAAWSLVPGDETRPEESPVR